MARQGLFDTTAVPAGLFDRCGQDQGWFDRDLLTYPAHALPPWYLNLLYIGGWDETADVFNAYVQDSGATANVASAELLAWRLGGWEEDEMFPTRFGVPDLEARIAKELGIVAQETAPQGLPLSRFAGPLVIQRTQSIREDERTKHIVDATVTVNGITYDVRFISWA